MWPATDVLLHINVKVLIVLRFFLEVFFPSISRPVKVLLADSFQIKILPVYVPSEQNLHTDFASRIKELPDLHLLPAVFQQMCIDKLFQSSGAFLLVTPFCPNQIWFPLLCLLPVWEVRRLPLTQDLIIDLRTNLPPHNLLDLHVVVWKLTHVSATTRTSPTTPSGSLSRDGDRVPLTATRGPGGPLKTFSWPEDFLSIPLL